MGHITIDLGPEQEHVLDLAVQSGAYRDRDEAPAQAFEIIREQIQLQDWMLERRHELAGHIAAGFAQAERGEVMDGKTALDLLRKRRSAPRKP